MIVEPISQKYEVVNCLISDLNAGDIVLSTEGQPQEILALLKREVDRDGDTYYVYSVLNLFDMEYGTLSDFVFLQKNIDANLIKQDFVRVLRVKPETATVVTADPAAAFGCTGCE